ncbi:LapA family protein [Pararhodobacter sp. SW119]|uniref:LapA family protein n=1 Tax=Pararhodobacter sp. SW119 TaxID=2780075 RepID=UPI001AE07B30|nr:LapA family protein [Pararhodobacter sp. SW119]
MTYLRYAVLILVLAFAVMVALANSGSVTLSLWPGAIEALTGTNFSVTLPLFLVVGLAVGLGLVLGLIWEWWRERALRAEGARAQRELSELKRGERSTPVPVVQRQRDEILDIVDEPAATR